MHLILDEIVHLKQQLEQDRRDHREQMQELSIKLDRVEQACSDALSSTAAHPNPYQGS